MIGSIVWSTLRYGITPTPTSPKVKEHFIDSLPNNINGTILELGAGWGTLAFPIAARYPDCSVVAYEISPIPYFFCKIRQLFQPCQNLTFKRENFFMVPFTEASLIVCYLYPGAMRKLKNKFLTELQPNTTIATHTFAIPGWTPVFTESVNDLYNTQIYHYQMITLSNNLPHYVAQAEGSGK